MAEKIEISHRTIIFTVLFLILLWFLYHIRDIILLVFISFVAMAALNPIVNRLEKYKVPRFLAILILYLVVFGVLIGLLVLITPILVAQTNQLLKNLPGLVERFNVFNIKLQLSDYSDQLAKLPANVFKIIAVTFSNIVKFFSFIVITFYLLIERKNLDKHLQLFFRRDGEKQANIFIRKLERKIGGWVRGEVTLMLIVGLLSYIGLFLLDLEFALPLAVLAGFLELIPNIGPTIAMIPAIIVGFAISPVMGITVAVLYFLIQQLENNFIVPKVMQKSVGLNPLVTLIVLLIGLRLAGTMGMLLAVPVFLTLSVVAKQVYKSRSLSSS